MEKERGIFEGGGIFGPSYSWPRRNFGCSFCKRQFGSAQALGGHMNVHRKDRAKLCLVSSTPSPSPSSSSPSPPAATLFPPCKCNYSAHHSLSLMISPSLTSFSSPSFALDEKKLIFNSDPLSHRHQYHENVTKIRKSMTSPAAAHFDGDREKKFKVVNGENNINVRLDLEMGLFGDTKEELDLELRLGYSS